MKNVPEKLPVYGRSMQVDATFPYYQGRSPESIASELRVNGYRIVRYVLTAESSMNPAHLKAFHAAGIGVWFVTFCNGTYTSKDLPAGWERWRMVTRTVLEGKKPDPSFIHLCLNNPQYRAWKKKSVGDLLRAQPFQGVDLVEPHWPEYPGTTSPAYGCFCDACKAVFKRMYPEEEGLPTLLDPDGPRGEKGNPALWAKWLEFRTASLTEFLEDLMNGPGGIRRSAPGVKVCVWTLPLTEPGAVERMRRDSGEDAARVARIVRPDLYGFQTHWPDWLRKDLPPDYPAKFKPFFDQVRAVDPKMPLLVQADTGSGKDNRRSWQWIRAFEETCEKLGVGSTTCYEYFIGGYMYTDPPRIARTERTKDGSIALHFTKRLDAEKAAEASRYTASVGIVKQARVDGSIVHLTLDGVSGGQTVKITARDLPDDEKRRLFHDHPPTILREQTVTVRV
jgi:hypothetical protein